MNRNLLFFLLFAVSPFFVLAQVDETKPYEIAKAVAYIKTAPLSELAARLSPDKADAIPFEKEVKNRLDINKWPNDDLSKATENVQTKMGQRVSRGPGVGFSGQGPTGFYPPDTDGDVSDDHFVQMVNSKYNVYEKDGTKILGPMNLSTLWDQLPPGNWGNDGDPIVLWDEDAERWVLTQFRVNSSQKYQLFAISESSDPLGAYHLYAFSFGTTMNDYPKIGVWRDGYYATYNMFQNGSFTGSRITTVERDKMLIGDPDAQMVSFHKTGHYSTMPADIDGEALPLEGDDCPVMYITAQKTIRLYDFHVDWEDVDNSYLNLGVTLSPASFNAYNPNIPQLNGQGLNSLSGMIMNRLAYRKFDTYASMVTNHTVHANGKCGVRWYEFRKDDGEGNNWVLYQEGTYAPDSDVYRWMGSAAMNGRGDISIAYSVANNVDVHPSIRYTGRLAADPLGEMTITEVELKTGTSSQSGAERWGDYSCLNVDPADDTTFWFTTEYNGWKTWISSYDLGGISGPNVNAGEDGIICTNDQFTTSASGSGILNMEWTSNGDGFFSPSNGFEVTYIRGGQDVVNGGCTLTLTATGFDGVTTASDDLELSIAPSANAGPDAEIWDTESFTCEGTGTTIGTIEWTTSGDGDFSEVGIMTPIYTPGETDLANGYATLTLTTAVEFCDGDKSDDMLLSIQTVGVNDLEATNKLSIYPNPTNDIFTLNIDGLTTGEEFTYMVYTSYGKEVFRQVAAAKANTYERLIDMSDFVAGIYFVSVQTENGNTTMKLVKK